MTATVNELPAEACLPDWYRHVTVETNDAPISVELEVARWLAAETRRRGRRPTVLFRRVVEHPGTTILGNPYPRAAILAALDLQEQEWPHRLLERLAQPPPGRVTGVASWKELSGLDALPVLWHRPGDAGRYITAGVGVTRSPDSRTVNLGFYRIQVVEPRLARIFFDPRTDAYRNWSRSVDRHQALPIAVFLGANPAYMLAAASRLPPEGDDYEIVARMLAKELVLTGEPPVPVEAHYVIRGRVTSRLELEGPFAEFKGYYVEARQSPVLQIDSVVALPGALYPAIVTGADSGLTLMALQNEYLMHTHLVQDGFSIFKVRYLLEGRGEFVTIIECPDPTRELLRSAMGFDTRTKLVFCGRRLDDIWQAVGSHGFDVLDEPYVRKGRIEGRRVGLVFDRPPTGDPVEY
jgi:2,5-furandicarboxylate decarboxylase 1